MEMLTGMEGVLILATGIGVFVTLLIQLVKMTYEASRNKQINNNWIPLIAVILGMLIGVAVAPFTPLDIWSRLWAGGISGFMASGIYETVKKTKNI